jgi:pyruvate/oxaloacetate carboxyltransferase
MRAKNITFNDLTLRDGQQSIAATRMNITQAMRVLPLLKDAGFYEIEAWGGAVPDSCVRFLNEDPWERLETYRNTLGGGEQIRALLRGQNLFAYQPYPDDLVIAIVRQSIESGVGNMRVFDALNDWRNLQIPILASKAYGAVVDGAICYTTSPVHTLDYFINTAKKLESEGVDRITIKDIAGLLYPTDALKLFKALKETVKPPITFHSHTTTGVGLLDGIIGMQAGVDSFDVAVTPFAGGPSHPPAELLAIFADEMGIRHSLDQSLLGRIQTELFDILAELKDYSPYYGKFFRPYSRQDVDMNKVQAIIRLVEEETEDAIEKAIPLSRELMNDLSYPSYDDRMFSSQIPGGMLTNLISQLKAMGQEGILDQVMEEVPRVRADLGYVTLVTPTSQIIGSQAAFNVITGQRYSILSDETKMLLRGEFGRAPAPFNPELVERALEDGSKQIVYRPASYLEPALEKEYNLPFVHSQKDLLLHLMLGVSADEYLEKKYA